MGLYDFDFASVESSVLPFPLFFSILMSPSSHQSCDSETVLPAENPCSVVVWKLFQLDVFINSIIV